MFHWHRPLILEDVQTARAHRGDHVPLHPDAHGRRLCASATHKTVVPTWPCEPRHWAEKVLDAYDRGEIRHHTLEEAEAAEAVGAVA